MLAKASRMLLLFFKKAGGILV
jgi:hypothetical protein